VSFYEHAVAAVSFSLLNLPGGLSVLPLFIFHLIIYIYWRDF